MNTKNMSIQPTETGFSVVYRSNIISTADVACDTGRIVFTFADGNISAVDISAFVELSHAYNRQFGITVTDDGTRFFVQSWEGGLFCFETQTGKLLWHSSHKRAFETATHDQTVLCFYQGQGICAFDIYTGMITQKYTLTTGATFKPLSRDYYLVGPRRGFYEILDGSLERKSKIPVAILNPNRRDTFIIQEASLVEDGLMIAGVEYTAKDFLIAVKAKCADAFVEKSRFVRQVTVSIP